MCFSSIRCSYFSFIIPTCSCEKENASEPRLSCTASHSHCPPWNTISSYSSSSYTQHCVYALLFGVPSKARLITAGKGQRGILSRKHSSEAVPLPQPCEQVTYFFPGILSSSKKTGTGSFILFHFPVAIPVWFVCYHRIIGSKN